MKEEADYTVGLPSLPDSLAAKRAQSLEKFRKRDKIPHVNSGNIGRVICNKRPIL